MKRMIMLSLISAFLFMAITINAQQVSQQVCAQDSDCVNGNIYGRCVNEKCEWPPVKVTTTIPLSSCEQKGGYCIMYETSSSFWCKIPMLGGYACKPVQPECKVGYNLETDLGCNCCVPITNVCIVKDCEEKLHPTCAGQWDVSGIEPNCVCNWKCGVIENPALCKENADCDWCNDPSTGIAKCSIQAGICHGTNPSLVKLPSNQICGCVDKECLATQNTTCDISNGKCRFTTCESWEKSIGRTTDCSCKDCVCCFSETPPITKATCTSGKQQVIIGSSSYCIDNWFAMWIKMLMEKLNFGG